MMDGSSAIAAGVEEFNAGRFWHAHEEWERLWLISTGSEKEFIQGLIQLAAAYHHVQRGTLRGAVRLFDSALRRIDGNPGHWSGLQTAEAVEAARRHRQAIEHGDRIDTNELPKLRYNSDSLRPDREPHASEG